MSTISVLTPVTSISSTSTLTYTVTASVGDLLLLGVAADNAGTAGAASLSTTVTDSAGNTWTNVGLTNESLGGSTNDGTTLGLWQCLVTSALTAGTVTINFSPNTTSKAAAIVRFQPDAGKAMVYDSAGAGWTGSSTAASTGNVSVPFGSTIVGFTAWEMRGTVTADSDTTNGSWSAQTQGTADTGSAGTSQIIDVQYKAVTSTGNQSYDTGTAATRRWAINYVIVHEKTSASLAATETADTAAVTAHLTLHAALAATETADSAAFTAHVYHTAQLAVTEAADSAAVTAHITLHAALTATEAADSAAVTAHLTLHAALAATETADHAAITAHITDHAAFAGHETADAAHFVVHVVHRVQLAAVESADRASFEVGPVWPSVLPKPTIAGYSLKPGAAVLRQAMEMGASRVYRRSPPLTEVAVVWQLDSWQRMLLDGFYESRVGSGATWFATTLALPAGMTLVSARFKDKLSAKPLGGARWTVTASLELRRRPVMTDADLTTAIGSSGTDWPTAILGKPLVSSWEIQPQPELLRSDDGPGLPQQRRRSRSGLTMVPSPQWELSASQAAIFDGFFRNRAKDGAQWFSFPVYDGIGIIATDIRFTGEATWTPRAAGQWNVEAPFEVRERTVLSAAELGVLQQIDETDFFAAIEALHEVVQEGFPT